MSESLPNDNGVYSIQTYDELRDCATAIIAAREATIRELEAKVAGMEGDCSGVAASPMDWISFAIRDLCEIPYRDSPEGFPEGIVATSDEIREAIVRHMPTARAADGGVK